MKKTILVVGASLLSLTIWGQGTVNFQNTTTTLVTNSLTGRGVTGGTTFKAALYYLPDSATAPTSADFDNATILSPSVGFSGGVTVASGFFQGGTRSAPTATPGAAGWFQVRAWETAFGATYEAARGNTVTQNGRLALIGTSNIIRVLTADPTAVPTPTPAPLAGLQGFVLVPVPEPSTIGLGLLGLGALLALRRRK